MDPLDLPKLEQLELLSVLVSLERADRTAPAGAEQLLLHQVAEGVWFVGDRPRVRRRRRPRRHPRWWLP